MAKLTQGDFERLAALLKSAEVGILAAGAAPSVKSGGDRLTRVFQTASLRGSASAPPAVAAVTEAVEDKSLERKLTTETSSYVNSRVGWTAGGAVISLNAAWQFKAAGIGNPWWVAFDAALGAAFADAMIGGPGRPSKATSGQRAHSLVERIASVVINVLAQTTGSSPLADAVFAGTADLVPSQALVGGTCVIAGQHLPWLAGISGGGVSSKLDAVQGPTGGNPAPSETWPEPPSPASAPARTTHSGALAMRLPARDSMARADETLTAAIVGACAAIEALVGIEVVAGRPRVIKVSAPTIPTALLRLALLSKGRGAVVVCADKDAVVALAGTAARAALPATSTPGAVLVSGAEMVLRWALNGFASKLPGLQPPHRIVRLAEGALPAHVEHYIAASGMSMGAGTVLLQWLVPVWMVSGEADATAPESGGEKPD